jgi:hypothetical protein
MKTLLIDASGDDLFRVTVYEGGSRTVHDVTVRPEDLTRYAPGATPERLIEASFRFLLEREPKEAILRRFEISVIERYFPEYPKSIRVE